MTAANVQPVLTSPSAAYVHVPFCVHRCGYCDFTVVAGRDALIPRYLAALESELHRGLPEAVALRTLFLGGGTPTHLPPEHLATLLRMLREKFVLHESGEFSVEANPADLTSEKVRVLADFGVNRVSLGAQSFDATVLQQLERDHTPAAIATAVELLRSVGIENVSLDLIFGVPGQTLRSWNETLTAALALAPTHVSTYGLTFEKGTAFWTRLHHGQLERTPEETERDMYALAMDTLATADFQHYEISNFAQPGRECQHNLTYWRGEEYYAFGPGAARYLHGTRETNHRSVATWLTRLESGQSQVMDRETLTPEDRARERLILALRMIAGCDVTAFAQASGYTIDELAGPVIAQHLTNGTLEYTTHNDRQHLRLTPEGRFVADSVIVDLL